MRSSQVYRALDLVPNRYTLCQTISQSAQRIHVNGNPFESTVTAILTGIGDGSFHYPERAYFSHCRSERQAVSSQARGGGTMLFKRTACCGDFGLDADFFFKYE